MTESKKKWGYGVGAFSLLFAIFYIRKTYGIYDQLGSINMPYVALCVLGLVGSLLSMCRIIGGKWVLSCFYVALMAVNFAKTWHQDLSAGLYFLQDIDSSITLFITPGYGIDLLAMLMLALTLWLVNAARFNEVPPNE